MRPCLRALAPTPFVTIQDGERRGWRRFGITGAGAMDRTAFVLANSLVGNPPNEAVLEFGYAGGLFEVATASCRVAVTGGAFPITVDGQPVPAYASTVLRRGQRLQVGAASNAVWGYLAVASGFDLPAQFGSRSTHLRSAIGGLAGRTVQAGDELPLRAERAPDDPERWMTEPVRVDRRLRVVLGPQSDYFTDVALKTFLRATYHVTRQSDRMGYRLDGPPLSHAGRYNIISDGVLPGCVQVPGNGVPIVLLRDAPTTGGYPKIATMVESDIELLAQRRPGAAVRFVALSVEQAQWSREMSRLRLQALRRGIKERDLHVCRTSS